MWLATGYTDKRKGFPPLALQVQEILQRDPLSGCRFCFRGRSGNRLKVIWHRWPRRMPVYQAAGTRPLPVAERSRRCGDDLFRTARLEAQEKSSLDTAIGFFEFQHAAIGEDCDSGFDVKA